MEYIRETLRYPLDFEMQIQGYIRAARGYPPDPEIMEKGIQGRLPCIRKGAGMLEQGIQDQGEDIPRITEIIDRGI